ncbi:efflux RND transporter permease subunit [Lysinibacter cavernae]|uniref:HAE1 family hydrophobic/amphiphilic exporter-1 n=1 Tax=Lysinibacter cavernae TaxID=1640652 RepID=A0A7X5TV51_9MICO|nr:efflux RND transporter permease subunit [Lysinibacter cavernae]NIH55283.1 HAE1 family hydrophobic/amphiphilic exporter-1 [Lysinibacter cavernae]
MHLLTKLSLKNRAIVGLVTLAIVVIGLIATVSLKQELIPSTQIPQAGVGVVYPGASPENVAKDAVGPVEQAIKAIPGTGRMTSSSTSGGGQVQVEWDYGLDSEKMIANIRAAVDGVKAAMPAAVSTEVYTGGSDDIPAMQLVVTSDAENGELVERLESVVVPAFNDVSGVRKTEVQGKTETLLAVTLRPADLAAKKVTAPAVMESIRAAGVVNSAGTSFDGDSQLSVEVGATLDSVEAVSHVPIATESGTVLLSEIATIAEEPAEVSSIARADGRPSLNLSIMKNQDANAVSLSHAVTELIPDLEKQLGKNATLDVVFDQAPMIEQSIEDLSVEGGLGLLFAILVILVFLFSVRSTIITAISIPLSLLIAMIGLWVGDFTLNIFTLAALTVAVGRVVDDSIVVIENIKRRSDTEDGPLTAGSIVASVRQVAAAITASTITTVAVFLPIALIGGVTGELFRPFAVTISIALVASLIVSLTIVPVLAFWFLKPRKKSSAGAVAGQQDVLSAEHEDSIGEDIPEPAHDEDAKVTRLQRGYMPVLRSALKHPVVTLVTASVIFILTIGSTGLLKTDFLGDLGGQKQVSVSLEMPAGTRLSLTDERAAEIEQVFEKTPGIQTLLTTVGSGSTNQAYFTATLTDNSDVSTVAAALEKQLSAQDGAGTVRVESQGGDQGNQTVDVTIKADNEQALAEGSDNVMAMMSGITGLSEVKSDLAGEQPLLRVKVDRVAAAAYGFTQSDIGDALSSVLRGSTIATLTINGEPRDLLFRSHQVDATPADIAALSIPVSPLQQAQAQKAASDALLAEQEAMSNEATAKAEGQVSSQRSELVKARAEAVAGLGELRTQLAELSAIPAPEPGSGEPVTTDVLQGQALADALAQLSGGISQAEEGIRQIDTQLTELDKSVAESNAAQAESERLQAEQKALVDVTATAITVGQVAEVVREKAASTVTRIDGERAVTISAKPTGDDLGAISAALNAKLDDLQLPAGVTTDIGGASAEQDEAFGQLGVAMLLAIALVYIVMVATFRSLLQPVILLVSVPFAATGAILALLLTNTALGIPSMIGLLMLIGIVVTNAIVLIDLINHHRANGASISEAVLEGSRLRLRPIIMTACATIFALVPMALGLTGGGMFISQSLAVVVIGGLISSTLLTLILVPVLYALLERRGERKEARRLKREERAATRENPEEEQLEELLS